MTCKMHHRRWKACAMALLFGWLIAGATMQAQTRPTAAAAEAVLFRDVRVFDGRSDRLSAPADVLVQGNKIASITIGGIDAPPGATEIDGGGRTLMPGLIDAHWHAMMAAIPLADALGGDIGYVNLAAGRAAGDTLMRGFTSVRDVSGPSFGLRRAIDGGIVIGPRIWPSGAMVSQTGGHGDYRSLNDLPRAPGERLSYAERENFAVIADGADQVRLRVREQLMRGASQIKLAAGGGVSSNFDPLDVTQYTEAEVRAAVEAAENWGTYVMVHAYTPRAMQMAIRGGVKSIEHGHLIDEATAKLMAEKGIWLSIQPFLDDEDAIPQRPENQAKQQQVFAGTDDAMKLAKKYDLKTAWGTDTLFSPELATRQGAQLVKMQRWFTPAQVLEMATATNARLLALSGERNPYKGKLGVVEEGALADLLLVDGNPLDNLALIADPARNFVVIMKDGAIYKNTLSP